MSKSAIKKFRKNDYRDDEDVDTRQKFNKHEFKRIERALKTKDISSLVEDDDEEDEYFTSWEGTTRSHTIEEDY